VALTKDLVVDAGATFDWGFNYVRSEEGGGEIVPGDPYDLTGCDARMQVRRKITDATALLTLTTENEGIVIDGPEGRIDILITDLQTSALYPDGTPGKKLDCVYDLELVWPLVPPATRRKVTRLLEGKLSADPGVTRDNDADGEDDE